MAQIRSLRLESGARVVLLVLLLGGCKRESPDEAEALTSSLIFDNASPEMREALATRVDFRINDDNFARWEAAQDNLGALPRSAIQSTSTTGGNAVERAVARLQASPRARRAIEKTGLTVPEFVLATIALAQATEAAQTGKSTSPVPVPPENFQFVQRYAARVLRARHQERLARAEARRYDLQFDTSGATAEYEDSEQMRLEQAEQDAEMRLAETEMRREEAERIRDEAERLAERQRDQAEHEAEMRREQAEREAEMRREQAQHEAEMRREREERRKRDSARDSVPTLH
jgi:hypothetical protein